MSKKKPEENMPPPPDAEEDGPPPGPPDDDSPPLEDSEDDEDAGHRQSVMDDESFSGPPPLAEDPREKKVETVTPTVTQTQQQPQQAQTAKSKERVSVAPKGDKKLPHEKSKGGPPPQVVRVVMTDSNAQFITLRCDPSFTVEEFSQILAKKLSLKGKGQVDSTHFSLCLLDPRATRDPKRLQPTQNVLGAFKDQLLAAAGRYVLHLVPGSNISAGVNKTIRASFAVSPSTKSGKSPRGGLGGISEGLPTKTGVTGGISKSPAGKPTKEQLKEEELRKMNEDLKAKLAATEKQLKQQEGQLAVTNSSQQKRPSKGDTLSTPEISSKTVSPRNSKDKISEQPRKSNEKSPKPSPRAGNSGPFDKKQDIKSPQAQSRISEKKNVKQIVQQQSDDDDDETSPPPAPEDDEEQPSAPPQKIAQTSKPTAQTSKSTPTPTPTIPAPTPKSTPTPTPTTTATTPVKKKPIILMEETIQPVMLEEKEDLDLGDPSTYPPPPPSPKDIGGDEENTPKQQPQQQRGVPQQSGAKSPVNSQTAAKKPAPTKAPAPPPSSSNKGPSKPAPTKAPAPPPPSDDVPGSDSDSEDDDDDDDL